MLTTYIIIAIVFVFCALVCYASCSVAARADIQSEKYIKEKNSIMEGTFNNGNYQAGSYGWICPVCGRGNSPFAPTCPCKQWTPNWTITCEPAYKATWTTSTTTGGTINEAR